MLPGTTDVFNTFVLDGRVMSIIGELKCQWIFLGYIQIHQPCCPSWRKFEFRVSTTRADDGNGWGNFGLHNIDNGHLRQEEESLVE
jgi:hypothetical protein